MTELQHRHIQYADKFKHALKLIEEGNELLRGGPASYYIRKMLGALDYLVDRCCPLNIGDRVRLAKTPEVDGTGWEWGKHFLVAGSEGEVATIDVDEEGFRFGVYLDDETYKDLKGELVPIERKHLWEFKEGSIEKV